MNTKNKAKELVEKFYLAKDQDGYHSMNYYRAKQCALICVDEMLDFMILGLKWSENDNGNVDYWLEVKSEIELYKK